MRSTYASLTDIIVGAIALGVMIYGDLVSDRTLRLVGFVVVTICVVVAAILAAFRRDDG